MRLDKVKQQTESSPKESKNACIFWSSAFGLWYKAIRLTND